MKFSVPRFLLSLAVGVVCSAVFAIPYFNAEKYGALDRFVLVVVPAASATFILYTILPYLEEKMRGLSFANVERSRAAGAWLLGTLVSFLAVGFLSHFYAELYQILVLTFLSQMSFGVLAYYALGRARTFAKKSTADFFVRLTLFLALSAFSAALFRMSAQFPILFKSTVFLLENEQARYFLFASLLSLPLLAWTIIRLKEPRFYHPILENKPVIFLRKHFSGVALAAVFFYVYLLLGSVLNHPRFDTDDIFFDADGFIWRFRLTTDNWQDFYWRSVHPLALLLLKPAVNFLSLFLNGNLEFAAIALTALAGAACVFLAWLFLYDVLKNTTAALIMSALLGLSATHLFFSALIETYIFLAAVTLFCFVLMQRKQHSLPLLVSVGVVTLGITLTNFAQTVVAIFCSKPDVKFTLRYISIVIAATIALMLAGNIVYPNASPYFFVPSTFQAEEQNMRPVSYSRIVALTRAFVFNNIAAPTPMMAKKDIPFTQFRFYRAEDLTISGYDTPLQAVIEKIWMVLLLLAVLMFFKDFKSHPAALTMALLGCVAFNLLLHLRYGKELFLYSPNWTYAIVLLLGIAWKNLLQHKWFQVVLIAFLVLLMANNAVLFETIMRVSSPYIVP